MLMTCNKSWGFQPPYYTLFIYEIMGALERFVKDEFMIRRNIHRPKSKAVSIYMDQDTELKLLKAADRSGRSKSAEIMMRLRDHLSRFPNFYNSETTEVFPNN